MTGCPLQTQRLSLMMGALIQLAESDAAVGQS